MITGHALSRLLDRYGILNLEWRKALIQAHTKAILNDEVPLLGARKNAEVFEVVNPDGTAYYPVWIPFEGPIVTYLTKGQAYWGTGWQFLL